MIKFKIIISALILTALAIQPAFAGVNLDISLDENGLKDFHLTIGEHYKVSEKEIIKIRKKNTPEEDIPVIFFISSKTGVHSSFLINLRLKGKTWMEITRHFGLTASIFYVDIKKKPGPPYGNAWGHFKNKKKSKWKEIHLSDGDIVNLVNLKFIANHYGMSPDKVVEMRTKGRSFIEINQTFKQQKAAGKEKHANKNDNSKKDQKKDKKKKK